MSASIEMAEDCASNYGVYEVEGSKGDTYTVALYGSEAGGSCDCPGFKFRGDCKHLAEVYEGACLYNPQWHDANPNPAVRPTAHTYTQFSKDGKCECGERTVYVKRAF